jgi:hypothetical protein
VGEVTHSMRRKQTQTFCSTPGAKWQSPVAGLFPLKPQTSNHRNGHQPLTSPSPAPTPPRLSPPLLDFTSNAISFPFINILGLQGDFGNSLLAGWGRRAFPGPRERTRFPCWRAEAGLRSFRGWAAGRTLSAARGTRCHPRNRRSRLGRWHRRDKLTDQAVSW